MGLNKEIEINRQITLVLASLILMVFKMYADSSLGNTPENGGSAKKKGLKGAVWMGVPGKNMIFNPGFELGWTGWVRDHWNKQMETTIAWSKAVPGGPVKDAGMGGSRAFRLSDETSTRSFCFPLEKGQRYTVSAYFNAQVPNSGVWWAVISPEWKMQINTIADLPVNKWTRRSFSFTWKHKLNKMRGYLRIQHKNCLIDRVQVEKGELSPYEPPPVTLGLNALDGKDNIFVRGREKAQLIFVAIPSKAVTTKAKAFISVEDAWEQEVWKKEFTIQPGIEIAEVIDIPTQILGTFEADMKAVNAKGQILGISTARFAVIDPPAPEHATGKSPFAVCYELAKRPPWVVEREAPVLALMGVHWTRYFGSFLQGFSKPMPENYVAAIKKQVEPLINAGIRPIACMHPIPENAKKKIIDLETSDQQTLKEYGEHIREIVKPLKKEIKYWEILNEPNLWRFKKGLKKGSLSVPAIKYFKILKTAYEAIKSVDPDLQVVGGAVNKIDWDWIEKLLQLGGAKYMDVFSFHPYRSTPDQPNVYPELIKLRALLDKYGFKGPMINSEQYFAADLYFGRGSAQETRRGYYVKGNEELRAAGRTIRNFIHHAAAGVPYCAYAVNCTHFQLGGSDPFFLYDLYAAHNAATRFLETAGSGEMLGVGSSMRIFIFPDAKDGPLLTVNAPSVKINGHIKIMGSFTAYDIMGNPIPRKEIVAKGVPVRTDPCYVRFPKGTSIEKIKTAVKNAELVGMGEPFSVDIGITGERQITVEVSNRYNKPLSGTVKLQEIPKGWSINEAVKLFKDLAPEKKIRIPFDFAKAQIKNLGKYPLTVMLESDYQPVRFSVVLSPVFAKAISAMQVDGNLIEWKNADWINLGDDHVSKQFNINLNRKGENDLSARMACGWTKDYFAIALQITDDRHVPAGHETEIYKGDSVQIYFDQCNDAADRPDARKYDSNDISYSIGEIKGKAIAYLDKGGSERYIGEANKTTGLDVEVNTSIVRKGNTTIYEIRFPRKTLPEVKLKKGAAFGFSILINDNDGRGRKTGLTLSPKGTEPYSSPHLWRDLILVQ